MSTFKSSLSEPGMLALDQYNGRFRPTLISPFAVTLTSDMRADWVRVPSSLFRIGIIYQAGVIGSMGILRPLLLVVGLTLLALGLMLKLRPYHVP